MTVNRHGQNIERKQARERIYSKARYALAKKCGLCIICRAKPPDPEKKTCTGCRRRGRSWKWKMRRRKNPHLQWQHCRVCGEPGHNRNRCVIIPGRCRCGLSLPCNSCLAKNVTEHVEKYMRRPSP